MCCATISCLSDSDFSRVGKPDVDAAARAAVLAITVLFATSYFFVAAVRLWKGIDIFGTDTLRNLVAIGSNGCAQGGSTDSLTALRSSTRYRSGCSRCSSATLLELAVPLVVVSKWARRVIPPGLLSSTS